LIYYQETAHSSLILGWRGLMSLFTTPVSDDSNTPRRRFTGAGAYHQTTYKKETMKRKITNPHFPAYGPSQWLFQGPPAESKFLAVTNSCLA
jgi:hypothetical protein